MHIKLYLIQPESLTWQICHARRRRSRRREVHFFFFTQIQKYGPRHQKFSHCLNLSARLSLKRLSSFEVGTFHSVYGTKARDFS